MAMNKKTIATIEVRLNSSRMPSKALLSFKGKSMIRHMIDRVKKSKYISEIIVCASDNILDDILIIDLKNEDVVCHRGSESDVLSRVANAISDIDCDAVVGLTGDCPLIDFNIIDDLVKMYLFNNYDYVSTGVFENRYPDGFDVQVYNPKILQTINKMKLSDEDREHVTSFIYRSGLFQSYFTPVPDIYNRSDINVTLDTIEDFYVISSIMEHFSNKNKYYGISEIISYLDNNPKIKNFNSQIKRKYLVK